MKNHYMMNTENGIKVYFDASSSTSTGWYMGQGTDREEHVHEGMQTLDGGEYWSSKRRRPNWI